MIERNYTATAENKNIVVKFNDKVIRYELDSNEMAQDVSNLFNQKDVSELSEIWDIIFESINQYKKHIA
ncbi:MAG: hypothetical protein ACNI25_03525 [Halarcobacter sp.]